jgi:hypothetical protein
LGRRAGETSITRHEYLEHLTEDVGADTGIENHLVHGGEIIAHIPEPGGNDEERLNSTLARVAYRAG